MDEYYLIHHNITSMPQCLETEAALSDALRLPRRGASGHTSSSDVSQWYDIARFSHGNAFPRSRTVEHYHGAPQCSTVVQCLSERWSTTRRITTAYHDAVFGHAHQKLMASEGNTSFLFWCHRTQSSTMQLAQSVPMLHSALPKQLQGRVLIQV